MLRRAFLIILFLLERYGSRLHENIKILVGGTFVRSGGTKQNGIYLTILGRWRGGGGSTTIFTMPSTTVYLSLQLPGLTIDPYAVIKNRPRVK